MKITDYDIVGSYNNQRVSSIDAERSVNCFEYIDPLGKKLKTLISTSGLNDTQSDFGAVKGGFRAEYVFGDFEYSVIGDKVFRRDLNGVVIPLGTLINSDSGYVGVDANTFQVIFVDGENGYIWDTMASTFTMITDSSFPVAPIDVCYLDGFFVVANGDTNTFQLSSFNQGLVWGPASNTITVLATTTLITVNASTFTPPGPSGSTNYATGTPVTFATTGSLPAPLNALDTYYTIHVNATQISVATSYLNAIHGIAISLTTNGSGTNTIISDGQLQEGSITTHPGTIVACRTLHRRLFLFSQNFTEVWENAGIGTNLPFRRNNSLLMEYGTPAVGSIAVSFDNMFFLAQDRGGLGSVMQVMGTQSIPVSNRALDFQLAQYAANDGVSDCVGFLIKENGLIFYRMNFTTANHTFVYDVTLSDPSREEGKLWHEEEVLNGDRHPAQTHAYFGGINYVGNYASPILYQVDAQQYTNAGEPIRRMRIGKAFCPPTYQRLRIDRFQIDLLQGQLSIPNENIEKTLLTENGLDLLTELGEVIIAEEETNVQTFINSFLLTENGSMLLTEDGNELLVTELAADSEFLDTPFMFLSISRDGGQTYGYTIKAPMGRVGDRTFRTVWRKLGTTPRGQAFVPKLEFFSPLPFVLLGAAWAFEVMPE